jgi:hypothetical protein
LETIESKFEKDLRVEFKKGLYPFYDLALALATDSRLILADHLAKG